MTHPANGEIERYTDHYFNRSKQVIGKFGDARVTYAIFMRRPVVFAPRLALDWLQETGRARNTKVELDLRYAFSNVGFEAVLSPVFDRVANTLVDSFVKRAEQVYGPR